ncbi:MAG: GNAT family N-acetyltransferase [Actinobacteria bacterium]|nr:GNAT family N-acetyltransferase [Actinomycetota bacterium]
MNPSSHSHLSARVVTDVQALRPFTERWRELAILDGSPFGTPEWFDAALDATPGALPAVVVLTSGDELLGLLPLVRVSRRGVRTLRFPGDALGDAYPFLLAHDAPARHCWTAAGRALAALEPGWHAMLLFGADGDAPWIEHVAVAARCTVHDRGDLRRPGIDAPEGGWDGLLTGMSRGNRKETRRILRRIEEREDAELGRSETVEDARADMATLFHLHDLRWGTRGGSSIDTDEMRGVLIRFCEAAAGRGWLRLWTLKLEGGAAASELAWRIGDRQTHYQGGFDPEFSKLGVGIAVFAHAMRDGLEAGVTRIDLGQGESSYKMRFATDVCVSRRVVLTRTGRPAGLVARSALAGRRAAKTWADANDEAPRDRLKAAVRALRARPNDTTDESPQSAGE